ncbi:unnamed protein product [Chrysoparadoxa australica]
MALGKASALAGTPGPFAAASGSPLVHGPIERDLAVVRQRELMTLPQKIHLKLADKKPQEAANIPKIPVNALPDGVNERQVTSVPAAVQVPDDLSQDYQKRGRSCLSCHPKKRRRPHTSHGMTNVKGPDKAALELGRMVLSSLDGAGESPADKSSRFFLDHFLSEFGSTSESTDSFCLHQTMRLERVRQEVDDEAEIQGKPETEVERLVRRAPLASEAYAVLGDICAKYSARMPVIENVRRILTPYISQRGGKGDWWFEMSMESVKNESIKSQEEAETATKVLQVKERRIQELQQHILTMGEALELTKEDLAFTEERLGTYEHVAITLKHKYNAEKKQRIKAEKTRKVETKELHDEMVHCRDELSQNVEDLKKMRFEDLEQFAERRDRLQQQVKGVEKLYRELRRAANLPGGRIPDSSKQSLTPKALLGSQLLESFNRRISAPVMLNNKLWTTGDPKGVEAGAVRLRPGMRDELQEAEARRQLREVEEDHQKEQDSLRKRIAEMEFESQVAGFEAKAREDKIYQAEEALQALQAEKLVLSDAKTSLEQQLDERTREVHSAEATQVELRAEIEKLSAAGPRAEKKEAVSPSHASKRTSKAVAHVNSAVKAESKAQRAKAKKAAEESAEALKQAARHASQLEEELMRLRSRLASQTLAPSSETSSEAHQMEAEDMRSAAQGLFRSLREAKAEGVTLRIQLKAEQTLKTMSQLARDSLSDKIEEIVGLKRQVSALQKKCQELERQCSGLRKHVTTSTLASDALSGLPFIGTEPSYGTDYSHELPLNRATFAASPAVQHQASPAVLPPLTSPITVPSPSPMPRDEPETPRQATLTEGAGNTSSTSGHASADALRASSSGTGAEEEKEPPKNLKALTAAPETEVPCASPLEPRGTGAALQEAPTECCTVASTATECRSTQTDGDADVKPPQGLGRVRHHLAWPESKKVSGQQAPDQERAAVEPAEEPAPTPALESITQLRSVASSDPGTVPLQFPPAQPPAPTVCVIPSVSTLEGDDMWLDALPIHLDNPRISCADEEGRAAIHIGAAILNEVETRLAECLASCEGEKTKPSGSQSEESSHQIAEVKQLRLQAAKLRAQMEEMGGWKAALWLPSGKADVNFDLEPWPEHDQIAILSNIKASLEEQLAEVEQRSHEKVERLRLMLKERQGALYKAQEELRREQQMRIEGGANGSSAPEGSGMQESKALALLDIFSQRLDQLLNEQPSPADAALSAARRMGGGGASTRRGGRRRSSDLGEEVNMDPTRFTLNTKDPAVHKQRGRSRMSQRPSHQPRVSRATPSWSSVGNTSKSGHSNQTSTGSDPTHPMILGPNALANATKFSCGALMEERFNGMIRMVERKLGELQMQQQPRGILPINPPQPDVLDINLGEDVLESLRKKEERKRVSAWKVRGSVAEQHLALPMTRPSTLAAR